MEFKLNRKQIIELLTLAGLSLALLLFLLLKPVGRLNWKPPKFDSIDKTEISEITWKKANGSEMQLRKEQGKWLLGDAGYPARQSYVDSLLEQLTQPQIKDLVSSGGNLATYDLDESKAYELKALKGEQVLRSFYVGKTSSSGRYSFVRFNDKKVYTIGFNLSGILDKSTEDLRDRVVMKFNEDDVNSFQLSNAERSVEVKKEDGKWQIADSAIWDEEKVKRLVSRFANMNAQHFAETYPSGAESYQLKFVDKAGAVYTMDILSQELPDNGGYLAKSSSYPFPFILNSYTISSMLRDFGFIAEEDSQDGPA